MTKYTEPKEVDTCIAFYEWAKWARFNGRPLSDFLFHIPNERDCKIQTGVMLKKMGVTKGVTDYMLPIPVPPYCGLFMEFKRKPNKPAKEQLDFIALMKSMGYAAVVVWNLEEAIRTVELYLTIPPEQLEAKP